MLPAVLGASAYSLTLATRMEMGRLQKGCRLGLHLGVDGRGGGGAAGRMLQGSRDWRLTQSVISNRQKIGPGHCQLSGFYCKPQATWDFLEVLVPRMKRFHEDFFLHINNTKTPPSKFLAHFITVES